MTDRLLTAREVGEMLGISSETVLRWVRRGELPAVRLPGGAVRFRPEALEQWLDGRDVTGTCGTAREPRIAVTGEEQ